MSLEAKDVAQYLKDHPEFFTQYADTLAQITLPDPHGGRAVSITERQIGMLREQIKRLENKLAELIRFGEENDVLSGKAHRIDVALAGATDVSSVLRVLYAHLGGDFAVPHVAVRLWEVDGDAGAPEFTPMSAAAHEFAAGLTRPYCGAGSGPDVLGWFGERGSHVRSLALVTLRRGADTFGLLALGSEEPQRFYPEMGTLYLERIGEVAAAALNRALGCD
ncbi:MAG: DUF484 family protein [Gammaproteobacteria bacterium]|nr:DUF484 family protein [Rhodocyclaceae bacterium]MBU3910706.1 DUF484 family protein [Gammaproteobacteria bacterium]MBU3988508.1 DUF484 family protein [Gammaproteobacteria bacterium]MBU4003415.1 DUF484 family protein [Gammaproteobacteria bacterium]MBU4021886.1 DUF484 family protein [Gammaproteobacteria bacterium]